VSNVLVANPLPKFSTILPLRGDILTVKKILLEARVTVHYRSNPILKISTLILFPATGLDSVSSSHCGLPNHQGLPMDLGKEKIRLILK
jgi:hypothetical protein